MPLPQKTLSKHEEDIWIKYSYTDKFYPIRNLSYLDTGLSCYLLTVVPTCKDPNYEHNLTNLWHAIMTLQSLKAIKYVHAVAEDAPNGMRHAHVLCIAKTGHQFKLASSYARKHYYHIRFQPIDEPDRDLHDLLQYIYKSPLCTTTFTKSTEACMFRPYMWTFKKEILPLVLNNKYLSLD